ncbi:MAG: hypothetical protein RL748_3308 [Pseudomonadota bacterium]|jgi:hypothetical protein
MPKVKLSDNEGLRAWANIVINNQETYEVPEVTTLVDIYNADDTAYLVIDVYVSRTTVNQYTFLSEKDNDKPGRLVLLFDFLKSVDFSLAKLLKWLDDAPFSASEMGDRVLAHGLAIYREFLTDDQPTHY